jgi:hypothetical protein
MVDNTTEIRNRNLPIIFSDLCDFTLCEFSLEHNCRINLAVSVLCTRNHKF